MRVFQILTTITYGDAVGNDVMALDAVLKKAGYVTGIYAENIGTRLPKGTAHHITEARGFNDDDIIVYHLSTGTDLNYKLPDYPGRKILVYHNITPPAFFTEYSRTAWQLCSSGLEGARFLSDKVDYCLADSEFNKRDLKEMGFRCPIDVLPILIPFEDYSREANKGIIEQYSGDGYTNILFTGRIAPNKCQEDVIAAFYQYHKHYNEKSRLILAGNYEGMEKYHDRLLHYAEKLDVAEDVLFTGHIAFDEILAYYHIADLFLCMSEHEGFCVPLIEAMYFDLPIIAYDSTAIPYTLDGSGFLLRKKDPLETAGAIDFILRNKEIRDSILERQRERLKDLGHDLIERQFLSLLDSFTGNDHER